MAADLQYSKLSRYTVLMLAGSFLGIAALFLDGRIYDDAYIHFRIARNFIETGLPYFNPSEPVMGTSAPLWTLSIIAVFKLVGVQLGAITVLNGLFSSWAAYFWTVLITKNCPANTTIKAVSFVSILAVLWPSSTGLMETPFAVLLLGYGFHLYRKRKEYSFLVLALAATTRPEFGIFLILCVGYEIFKKEFSRRSCSYLLIGIAPALIFCLYYFGTIIPHPIIAKSLVYELTTQEFIKLFFVQIVGEDINFQYRLLIPLYFIVLLALFFLSMRSFSKSDPWDATEIISIISIILIICGYASSMALIFPWYVPIILVPFIYIILSRATKTSGKVSSLVMVVVLVTPNLINSLFFDNSQLKRVSIYKELGESIYSANPTATVLTPEIGALGYSFKGTVIDALGLISPQTLTFHPLEIPSDRESGLIGAIPTALVKEVSPDYIVSLDIFAHSFLKSEEARRYQDISAEFNTTLPLWRSSKILVLKRVISSNQ